MAVSECEKKLAIPAEAHDSGHGVKSLCPLLLFISFIFYRQPDSLKRGGARKRFIK
jgi:hypothetical protein